jgi:hypothetical protein
MSRMAGTDRDIPRPTVKLTYDDFLLFPDDGERHELIDGEHYVTPSPNLGHQRALGKLYLAIANDLEAHPIGEVFFAPLDVVMSNHDIPFDAISTTSCGTPRTCSGIKQVKGSNHRWSCGAPLVTR